MRIKTIFSIIIGFIIFLLFTININSKYNEVGYDSKDGKWNLIFGSSPIISNTQYYYKFVLDLENKTKFDSISAIEIEFKLLDGKKSYDNQLIYLELPKLLIIGDSFLPTEISFNKPVLKIHYYKYRVSIKVKSIFIKNQKVKIKK